MAATLTPMPSTAYSSMPLSKSMLASQSMPQTLRPLMYRSLTHLIFTSTSASASMARATATAAMEVIITARSAGSLGLST